jgi:hypothetical protein
MKDAKPELNPSPDFMNVLQEILTKVWSDIPGSRPKKTQDEDARNTKEALLSMVKTWSSISNAALNDPLALSSIANGISSLPEIVSHLFQSGFKSYMKYQDLMMEKMKSLGKKSEAYSFDNLDQDSVKAWSEFYKNEIRQYLMVPQLGLVRFYQERFNQVIDKYHLFNATFAEFMQVLMMPMEKSFQVMHDKVEQMVKGDTMPADQKELYRMWVKVLEGHYMTLFKSPKFGKALADTLSSYEEYLSARNRFLTDAMQSLPIPTNKDLDDLYAEIYALKRKIKEMERAHKQTSH